MDTDIDIRQITEIDGWIMNGYRYKYMTNHTNGWMDGWIYDIDVKQIVKTGR